MTHGARSPSLPPKTCLTMKSVQAFGELLKKIRDSGWKQQRVCNFTLIPGDICRVSLNKWLCRGLKGHAAAVNHTGAFSHSFRNM